MADIEKARFEVFHEVRVALIREGLDPETAREVALEVARKKDGLVSLFLK